MKVRNSSNHLRDWQKCLVTCCTVILASRLGIVPNCYKKNLLLRNRGSKTAIYSRQECFTRKVSISASNLVPRLSLLYLPCRWEREPLNEVDLRQKWEYWWSNFPFTRGCLYKQSLRQNNQKKIAQWFKYIALILIFLILFFRYSQIILVYWLVLAYDHLLDRRIDDVINFFNFLIHVKQLLRFHVVVCLFSSRSQRMSKCSKNISDTLGSHLMCHFFVLPSF